MYIRLDKKMPNGSVAAFHYLDSLTIQPDGVIGDINAVVTVTSKTEDQTVCWQDRIPLAASQIEGSPFAAALNSLCQAGGYLAGGIVQVNPSPLNKLRATMLTRLIWLRDQRLVGGCVTPFGIIDTDLVSRQNVSGAVSMASIAKAAEAPFVMRWRMRDNSYVELTADQMIAVGVVVGRYISAVYAASFAIKDAIDAATDMESLEAISLEEISWPE